MSTILTTIVQMQAAGLDLDKNSKIEVFNPHIDASERNYLLPVLGKTFYDLLIADLDTETPAETTTDLLPYLRKPLAWNAYYLFFKKPVGSLSHSGFYKKTFDHSQAPAKWEIDSLKEELICNADKAIDELVDFLRENIEDYPTWEESDYFAQNANLIISKASEFDLWVKIGCSARVFHRLLFFRETAERNIKKTLCGDLHELIISQLNGSEAETPAITALRPFLQAVIAFDTMSKAILQVPFFRYGNDVMTWTYNDGTLSKSGLTATEARNLQETYKQLYEDARNELIAYLNDNIADYPEYENSACYSLTPRTLEVRYENEITKKHFGI